MPTEPLVVVSQDEALAKVKAIAALSEYPDGHTYRHACLLGDEYTLTFGDIRALEQHALTARSRGIEEAAKPFQASVQPWLMECFGAMIAGDREERNHRFLEEALELVQSLGCSASEAHQLVDYVYGRDVGHPPQEVGGVMVTLAALCLANDLDMHAAGWVELDRIWGKVEQIRAKQAAKPKHSPLAEGPPLPAREDVEGRDYETEARELLAAEYEKGLCFKISARAVRRNELGPWEQPAIRAIVKALSGAA